MKSFVRDDQQRQAAWHTLTPMIDCIFLLLIFFMYSRFRSLEGELAADLPAWGETPAPVQDVEVLRRRQILIEMQTTAEDSVVATVNGLPITIARMTGGSLLAETSELETVLRERAAAEPESFVILKPRQGVPFGCVIWCFDAARATGLREVSFAPPRGEGLPDV